MKLRQFRILLLTVGISFSATPQKIQKVKQTRELTLGEVRKLLLGKKVVVAATGSSSSKGYLLDWAFAELRVERYVKTSGADYHHPHLPASYQGQEAEVIAVYLNDLQSKRTGAGSVNALGEVSNEDVIVDPYCDVILKFSDDTVAITTSYASLIFSDDDLVRPFKPLSEKNERTGKINAQLPSIVGKIVYAVAFSELHLPSASMEAMTDPLNNSSPKIFDFPRLQPLTITVAKYDAAKDIIILKLKDAGSREYLTLSHFGSSEATQSFFQHVVESYPAALRTTLPSYFPPHVIAAIRKGKILSGMTETALYMSIGLPEKDNDYGHGGKQLIYFGGKLYVYLDTNGLVKNFQSFE